MNLFFITITSTLFFWASAIPVLHEIDQGTEECIYDTLEADEFVTMSVFIDDGEELKAKAFIQGPIADPSVQIGSDLYHHIQQLPRKLRNLELNEEFIVDMEHFDVGFDDDDFDGDDHIDDEIDDDAFLRDAYYAFDDDDEFRFMVDDSMEEEERQQILAEKAEFDAMSDEEKQKDAEERKERHKNEMEAAMEERKHRIAERQERRKDTERNKPGQPDNEEGEPLEKTFHVEMPGWYRVCVSAYWNEVAAELEMRKSSELGQPNSETGHLQSYDRRAMVQEEKRLFHNLDKKNKMHEDGVKEEDLDLSREQIQRLNRLLNEIREMQTHERHRLSIHATTNEHSHSRMVLSSLFETAFYIVVSGFQVWTVRRWFSGAPILGF